MDDFVIFVLNEIRSSLFQVGFILAIALGIIGWVWFRFRRTHGREYAFPWKTILLILVTCAYLIIVNQATLGRSGSAGRFSFSFHLFRAWREAWNLFTVESWLNVLLNILLFVPTGVLLPLWSKRFHRLSCTVFTGFLITLWIETCQLLLGKGIFDIDDLFCNTLGVFIGYCFFAAIHQLRSPKDRKRALLPVIGFLIPFIGIGSLFAKYEAQEYGNLKEAMQYRVDTSDVLWIPDFQYPEYQSEVPIYRTDVYSIEDCKSFGRSFGERLGTDFFETTVYGEKVCMTDRGGNDLTLFCPNRAFEYEYYDSIGLDEKLPFVPGVLDEDQAREILAGYLIELPENARFESGGDGWYRFETEDSESEDPMTSGTVSLRYSASGRIYRLVSTLSSFRYYGRAQVIAPEVAYERLTKGYFLDSEEKMKKADGEIRITDCKPDTRIDSKGFRQPVYVFEGEFSDSHEFLKIIIPAIL